MLMVIERIGRLSEIAVAMNRSALWGKEQELAFEDNIEADIDYIDKR
jgi:hypothetical protein